MKYLNSLIDLIQTNLSALESAPSTFTTRTTYAPGPLSPAGSAGSLFDEANTQMKVSDTVLKHFKNVMAYVQAKKEEEGMDSGGIEVPAGIEGGFADVAGTGSWKDVDVGRR